MIRIGLCSSFGSLAALLLLTCTTGAQSVVQPEVRTLGSGTPGALGIPQLAMFGSPVLGNPFALYVENVAPGSVGSMFVSTQELPIPLAVFGVVTYPGVPLVALPFVADADGRSPRFVEQLPTPASLVGARIVAQGLVLDATAQGGVAFTPAVRAVAGEAFNNEAFPYGRYQSFGHQGVEFYWTELENPTLVNTSDLELADLDEDGTLDLIAGGYPRVDIALTRPGLTFETGVGPLHSRLPAIYGTFGNHAVTSDFDLDGHVDMVVCASSGNIDDLQFHHGFGDGSFALAVDLPWFESSYGYAMLEAGDWDNDGVPDLIVSSGVSFFELHRGNGDGTFDYQGDLPDISGVGAPRRALIEDLDNDGIADIVVGGKDGAGSYRGLGNGQFQALAFIDETSGDQYRQHYGMALGDVDGDGFLDMSLGNDILLGVGDGTFVQWQELFADLAPPFWLVTSASASFGDLDGDGDLDLGLSPTYPISGYFHTLSLMIFENDGAGNFAPLPRRFPSLGVRFADLNDDGILDLVLDGQVIRGLGNLLFEEKTEPHITTLGNSSGNSIALADLNGDDLLDVVVGGFPLRVLHGDRASWNIVQELDLTYFKDVELVDLNGDLVLDVVGPASNTNTINFALGDGTGKFTSTTSIPTGQGLRHLEIGDLNSDGIIDLVTSGSQPSGLSIHLGLGSGAFAAPTFLMTPTSPRNFALADLNGDDILDVAIPCHESDTVVLALGLGGGTFGPLSTLMATESPTEVIVGHIDDDGRPDLIVGSQNELFVLHSTGPIQWSTAYSSAAWAPSDLKLADVTGDGLLDLMFHEGVISDSITLIGSIGSDAPAERLTLWSGAGDAALADWNGDLLPDLMLLDHDKLVGRINQRIR